MLEIDLGEIFFFLEINFLTALEISEDENKKLSDQLQKMTDRFIEEIDNKITDKEQEILKI